MRPSPRRAGHPSEELWPADASLSLLLVLPLQRLAQVLELQPAAASLPLLLVLPPQRQVQVLPLPLGLLLPPLPS